MKTISLKLPDDLDQELTTRAESSGTTKSALIREAIEGYLADQEPGDRPGKGTFLELAGDLIGSLEGPGDLSYNRDYLKDYSWLSSIAGISTTPGPRPKSLRSSHLS